MLGGAFVFICFGYLNGNLLVTLGQQSELLRISVLALVVNLIGNLILVPLVGFMGAAWMTLATEIVVFIAGLRLILATLELPLPRAGRIGRTDAGRGDPRRRAGGRAAARRPAVDARADGVPAVSGAAVRAARARARGPARDQEPREARLAVALSPRRRRGPARL